jgi:hypothetical protein
MTGRKGTKANAKPLLSGALGSKSKELASPAAKKIIAKWINRRTTLSERRVKSSWIALACYYSGQL